MSILRRRTLPWLIGVSLLGGMVVSAPAATAVAGSTNGKGSPNQVVSAALAAARSETAVDTTYDGRNGATSVSTVTDSGEGDGLQFITLRQGTQTGSVSIILIGPVVYLRGNEFGLRENMDFTAAAANEESGHWIRAASTAGVPQVERRFYQAASGGLTLSSQLAEIDMSSSLSFVPAATMDGEKVVGVQTTLVGNGGRRAHVVLYLRSGGLPLPVAQVATMGDGESFKLVFGPWGQVPAPHAPRAALSFNTAWLATA